MKRLVLAALIGLGLTTVVEATAPLAQPVNKDAPGCFLASDWNGWKATADAKTLYIRAGLTRFFKLDLASSCPMLNLPSVHLVTHLHGPWICHALDLDLHVSDGHGMSTPCIVSNVTPLTAEEASALPPLVHP